MKSLRSIARQAYMKATEQRWNIGFIYESLDKILLGAPISIKVVKHNYKDGWFADPFILDVDENYIYLLVEELYYPTGKGRISKLTIQRKNNRLLKVEPILQLSSHLSFPAIKSRSGESIKFYPENGKGLGLALYDYNIKTNSCKFDKLISDRPFADAIITGLFGKSKLYATEIPTHNGDTLNEYMCNENEELVLLDKIVFSGNIARNAGDWFRFRGKVYRPAQDCNNCYGGAVILQEVKEDNGKLVFRDVRKIVSTDWRYVTGCHTFNNYCGISVVDLHGYVHPILGRLLVNLFDFYKRLF